MPYGKKHEQKIEKYTKEMLEVKRECVFNVECRTYVESGCVAGGDGVEN